MEIGKGVSLEVGPDNCAISSLRVLATVILVGGALSNLQFQLRQNRFGGPLHIGQPRYDRGRVSDQ